MVTQSVQFFRIFLHVCREGPVAGEPLDTFALARREPPNAAARVADVGATPIRACVAGRASVEAVGKALNYWPFDKISKAFLKGGKSFLPIRSALDSIPFAAFGLKKYLCGSSPVSMTSNNIDSLA
jgi:hypothetical protein